MKIHIVDYGMGNIFSVQKKLLQENVTVSTSSDPQDILKADKIILLGVGHFKRAMSNLKELNLIDPLNNFALTQKKPILGICLGMQLMARFSEEGNSNGLGWIDASILKFKTSDSKKFKIPHTGWNTVNSINKSSLLNGLEPDEEFYFVHSFYIQPNDPKLIMTETQYIESFCSGVEKENIFGVQYHPEKSHDSGRTIFKNFISL
jgi:imidazole glycerol-phosphate synthase subunit HisH